MSARIKLSYETEEELRRVLALLAPVIRKWQKAAGKNGRYTRVYIELDPVKK